MIYDLQAYDVNARPLTAVAQWDTDINVYISNPGITRAYTVHFCSPNSKYALPVNSTYTSGALKVTIPNSLLRMSYPIVAYIYVDIDNGMRSMYRFRINVVAKPQPDDYVYTDSAEYVTIESLFAELRKAIAEAGSGGGSGSGGASGDYTNKLLLTYNGTNIVNDKNVTQTYSALYNELMVSQDFVVLVYNNRAYHPNEVSSGQIIFSSTYPSNGYIRSERITISNKNAVTLTYGEAEKTSSRVSSIADSEKTSTTKYPSIKAVVDYVDSALSDAGGGSSGSASQYPGCVYVDDYKVNGASDIKAINDAIAAATTGQYYSKLVVFASRQYTITEPILLKNQLKFVGSSKGLTSNGTAIVNESTNMFTYGDVEDLTGIVFDGIAFCGNKTNHNTCCFPALPRGKKLNFRALTIKNGGFKWFKQVFEYPELLGETSAPSIAMTLCNLSHLHFTSCETIGSFTGSDNTFYDWNAGDSSLSDVDVLFDVRCNLSRFDNLYFTGKVKGDYGAKCIMQLRGATNVVSNCWFDYSDQAGLRIAGGNAHDNTVTNCLFRGNSRVSGADIEFVANGDLSPCDNIITGNAFVRKYHESSADQGNTRISIDAKCKRNTISRNTYDIDGGVVFKITNNEATTIIDEPAYGIDSSTATSDSILAFNPDSEFKTLIAQSRGKREGNADSSTVNAPCITLLHCSDFHGDYDNFARLVEFYEHHSENIDNVIHTGDSVSAYFTDSFDWNRIKANNPFLNAIGNHDSATKNGSTTDWSGATSEQCYQKYFAPYIANWGVTSEQNKCYYYKDFAESNLRLVVLDDMHIDEEQLIWFANVLTEAYHAGYHLVCAKHYAASNIKKFEGCTFSDKELTASGSTRNEFYEMIAEFKAAGGKFVAWLTGHFHGIDFGTHSNPSYPGQAFLVAPSVSTRRSVSTMERETGTKSQDAFYIMTIDTTHCWLKVITVGADTDRLLRQRKMMTYDYANNKIIKDNPGIERVYDFDALGGVASSESSANRNADILQGIIDEIAANAGTSSSGAMVLFRSPFYYFGKQVSMYRLRGVTFAGLSPRTVLRNKCGDGVYGFKMDGLYSVTFRNLAFWGSGSNNGLIAVDSEPDTRNSRIANVFFEDCEFWGLKVGVDIEAATGYIRFHRTSFHIPDGGCGAQFGMDISTESDAYTSGTFPNYIYFTECTFEGGSAGTEKRALQFNLAQCITIDKCDFCNFTHATVPAITITPQPSKPVSHFLFRNNFFFNNKNSVMIDMSLGNLNGLSFIGNHCYVRSSDSTLIKVANGVSYHKVTGMTMAGNTLVGQSSYNYKILEASYVDRLLIQDEMDVFDPSRYVLTNCTNVTRMGDFESAGNKASEITEDNKDSTDAYPSVKAVTDLIGYLASQIPSGDFEDTGNKAAEWTEDNKDSTTIYPSMKAVTDLVGYVATQLSQTIPKATVMTQGQYDSLSVKDQDTFYFIIDS